MVHALAARMGVLIGDNDDSGDPHNESRGDMDDDGCGGIRDDDSDDDAPLPEDADFVGQGVAGADALDQFGTFGTSAPVFEGASNFEVATPRVRARGMSTPPPMAITLLVVCRRDGVGGDMVDELRDGLSVTPWIKSVCKVVSG